MTPSGFLNIDKPLHLTSHDVVARLRRGLHIDKIGHAGTLDPLATGVLVICIGAATRLSEYVMDSTKRYRARVRLGATTTTYDAEGEILSERDASHITRDDVDRVLASFTGDIQQVPPMYSAIKQGGKKLYDLARAGQTVERSPRAVRIDSLAIVEWNSPEFMLDVVCSAGTYIRSLAYDIGEVLSVGAHLSGLTRTASGSFTLENALSLDTLLNDTHWQQHLTMMDAPLTHLPAVYLDAANEDHIRHGRTIPSDMPEGAIGRAYATDGTFIAILQSGTGVWKPHKVFL
jgi:tRNA pseudouridine55 synthase